MRKRIGAELALTIFAVVAVLALFTGVPEGLDEGVEVPLAQVDKALGLSESPAAAVAEEPGGSKIVVRTAVGILVDVTPGCWREVGARRLWGWGWNPDGSQHFNTTYFRSDGNVVEETLTLEQILAINSAWQSWPQRCP